MTTRVVTVFRSRLRDDAAPGYEEMAAAMEARARRAPGFIDFTSFAAHDGERVSLITFASRATHDAWRDDPEHVDAQRRGQRDWYESYRIQVCELTAERVFPEPPP